MTGRSWTYHGGKIARSGGVGAFCALINLLILYLGTTVLSAHYLVSAAVSFGILTPLSYLLHKEFSFRDGRPAAFAQLARYTLNLIGGIVANLALMIAMVELGGMHYLWAAIAATILVFAGNYAVNAIWVFRGGH